MEETLRMKRKHLIKTEEEYSSHVNLKHFDVPVQNVKDQSAPHKGRFPLGAKSRTGDVVL